MNPGQQREHRRAITRVDQRIDRLAECVDEEVEAKMTEIRTVAATLIGAQKAYIDLMDHDTRVLTDNQIKALEDRLTVFETMTVLGLIRWLWSRAWR